MCAVELICLYAPVGILDFPVKQSLATATATAAAVVQKFWTHGKIPPGQAFLAEKEDMPG